MARREVSVSAPLDPGQLRAVKDGELRGYESTSLAVNSTNPDPASAAATTPSTQSQAPPDWVCARKARVGIRGLARGPVIRRLIITRDGVRQDSGGDKQHVTSLSVPWLFRCLCLFQSCVRAGAEQLSEALLAYTWHTLKPPSQLQSCQR
ncbi:unnamed protein product [Pleuronectes platessa]|uniref:Uncharacterized protein n=1 Tax=Pleuronectes platessa TaxID=8262 RepID=A0A9N7YEV4_PLEPL|nr:unnamed protein product [Pleuronectes platessa]